MEGSRRSVAVVAVMAGVALLAAACGGGSAPAQGGGGGSGGSGASANQASAPGVTPNQVTVGVIWSGTGPASAEYVDYVKAIQARFSQQNAQGGVFGRKLQVQTVDDQTSPSADQTAAQELVSKGVFGIIGASPVLFVSAKYLHDQGLPVVSGGYDGPEWGQQPYTNMFSQTGNMAPSFLTNGLNTGGDEFMKMEGATSVAALGYSISPSSSQAAQAVEAVAPKVGLKAGYLNTSIPFGGVNVEPIVLAMKQAKVDAVSMEMDDNTNFAIITAARQSGLKLKVALSATGYGQPLLDDKSALAAAEGAFFVQEGPGPDSAPGKAMQAALSKYAGLNGIPGFDSYYGYVEGDMFIKGLEVAGRNPTRQSFIDNLHKVTGYTAAGLLPGPVDWSLAHFGQAPEKACGWYATVRDGQFQSVPANGKPICGTRVSG